MTNYTEIYDKVLFHVSNKMTISNALKKVGCTSASFYHNLTKEQRIVLKQTYILNSQCFRHDNMGLNKGMQNANEYFMDTESNDNDF